jgi:hypothetical protein
VNGIPLRIACLDDLVARKKAAGRDRRGDAMPTKKCRSPGRKPPSRRARLDARAAESDRQLDELIRRRLEMPLESRMHFLRRRLPGGGSCL